MSAELEKGLVTLLSGIVSTYPTVPQGASLPAIRYQRIGTTRDAAIDGSAVGVVSAGMQVDCMATTYEAAKTLADSVRNTLHTYQGAWGTLVCRWCVLETENDFSDIDGDDRRYWVMQRYTVYTNMD